MEFTMAKKKVTRRARETTRGGAKPVAKKRIKAGPAAAGGHPQDNAETVAARIARINAERQVLAKIVPGSLASRLRQLISQGRRITHEPPDPENSSCMSGSFEHAIIRAAAIQIRAVALALGHDVHGESQLSPDLVLSNDETAFALASISILLTVGSKLADDLRAAQHESGGFVRAKRRASVTPARTTVLGAKQH
jgi:hypothetical protein